MDQRLLDDLVEWLRIPSISTGGGDPSDLERAAAWVTRRVSAVGGEARVVATEGNPLAVGELPAAREHAPTVLIYGHYDVQSVGDLDAWTTPPFAPDVRDGRVS
jgi:acetylornithine deacetylase/succinyl-diaminopimelate desuccinylase-like protein